MLATQRNIQRFAWQSFGIKGFSLTYLGLIIGIFNDPLYQCTALFIVLVVSVFVFQCMDAFYVKMEQTYRKIEENYDSKKGLSYKNYGYDVCIFKTLFSKTVWPIYFVQYALIIVLYVR